MLHSVQTRVVVPVILTYRPMFPFSRTCVLILCVALLPGGAESRTPQPQPATTVTLSRPDRPAGIRTRMLVPGRLSLRAAANSGAPVRVVIPANTTVSVLGCSRDWCHVSHAGSLGWVIRGALQLP